MNFLMTGISTNITMALISTITGTTNGIYTLCTNISHSTQTCANEIKQLLKETDLRTRMVIIQQLLHEIKVDKMSPNTLQQCIKSIKDSIKDISDELEKIQYRMQYNESLRIGSSFRSYGFRNCKHRLIAYVKTLDMRYNMLIDILSIQNKMHKKDLNCPSSKSITTGEK